MQISIIGQATTQFGELWDQDLYSLLAEVVPAAINSAELDPAQIEAVFVANKAGGSFSDQRHLNALVSQQFDHFPPAMRIEGACASGGLAVLAAEHALLAGQYQTVLVVGVEKMTDVSAAETTQFLASAANVQTEYGSTFPGLYALLAQAHQAEFGTTREMLSAVSVKNHAQALTNSKAQFHKQFSLTQVSASPLVADPLRMLDCSPISDGAAAVVLTTKQVKTAPKIIGFGHGQDSLDLAGRSSLTELKATQQAAAKAMAMAEVSPADIEVAEVHDCFTIAELLAVADLGFVEPDQAGPQALARLKSDDFSLKNLPKINISGGLKACGHPVGATGVKQLAFLAEHLAESDTCRALAHNVGGSGATAVVHVLETGGES